VPTFYTLLTSRLRDSSEKSDRAMAEANAPASGESAVASGASEGSLSPESPRVPVPGSSPAAGS